MDIRLVVVDVDGTIAGPSNQISEAVQTAIQEVQARGIPVAIATGRMYCSALRFHQAIASSLPLLAYNGAWIQDPLTEEWHQHHPVPPAAAAELLDYFNQAEWRSRLSIHCYVNDRLYTQDLTEHTEYYTQRCGVVAEQVSDLRELLDQPLTKILAVSLDPDTLNELTQDLQKTYTPDQLYLTQSSRIYFEASHPHIHKGSALQFLTEDLLGLQPENVLAIGDNFNDLEMLDYAGVGVAMGDAPPAVQAVAQWVAPDVEEEGVALALEKFILKA